MLKQSSAFTLVRRNGGNRLDIGLFFLNLCSRRRIVVEIKNKQKKVMALFLRNKVNVK